MFEAMAEVERAFGKLKFTRLPGITPDLQAMVRKGMELHRVDEFGNIVLTYERSISRGGAKIVQDMEKTLAEIAKNRQVKIALLKKAPQGEVHKYVTPDAGDPGNRSVSHYIPTSGNYKFAVLIWKNSRNAGKV